MLSKQEALILDILVNSSEELYGLQIVEASKGKLWRGTIYIILGGMEDAGLVKSRPEPESALRPEIGIVRRLYRPTEGGIREYRAIESDLGENGLEPKFA
ncbi:MAG: PadR family transcriptional regulator [Acidobacteriota bacterium]